MVNRLARIERGRRHEAYERKVTPGVTFSASEKKNRSEERKVAEWYDANGQPLDEFKLEIEQRKGIAKRLAGLQASQRATAEALGVGVATVNRDLAPVPDGTPEADKQASDQAIETGPVTDVTPEADKQASDQAIETGPVTDVTPEWFQEDIDPAKLAKGRSDRKKRDAESERRKIAEGALATPKSHFGVESGNLSVPTDFRGGKR